MFQIDQLDSDAAEDEEEDLEKSVSLRISISKAAAAASLSTNLCDEQENIVKSKSFDNEYAHIHAQ